MEISQLEYAAEILFQMCKEHPEICPHDYRWTMERTLENGDTETHYVCGLCGKKQIIQSTKLASEGWKYCVD